MKIRAAVVEERSGSFVIEELELESPRADEIGVQVAASGICRTDLHIRDVEYPVIQLPVVAGHEGVGTVTSVGTAVHGISVGDHVILPYPYCGSCQRCRNSDRAYCEHGFDLAFGSQRLDGSSSMRRNDGTRVNGHIFQQSSFATHLVAKANSVVVVDPTIAFTTLAGLGCGVQTGAGAIENVLRPESSSSLAIYGVGTVGLAALMMAKSRGLRTIILVDTNSSRLELGIELGATHAINASTSDIGDSIQRISPSGVQNAFDTTGHPVVLSQAFDNLTMTGTLVVAGAAPAGTRASLDMNVLLNGRAVRGTVQGDADSRVLIPRLLSLYRDGEFPVDRLITAYKFEDIESAVRDLEQGLAIKPVLVMN